eukprot:SM000094S24715  [mRNA]  locus=s94:466451:467297:+ [translate_table: standard]
MTALPSLAWIHVDSFYSSEQGLVISFFFRILVFILSLIAFSVMAADSLYGFDATNIDAYAFLVASMVLLCAWSLLMIIVEGISFTRGRLVGGSGLVTVRGILDFIFFLLGFAGACAAAGVTTLGGLFKNSQARAAVAMAFLAAFADIPCFFASFAELVTV